MVEKVLVPIVIMTGMFAMIFGIVYMRSRENMALIEKGLNPRQKDSRPRPFANLKWGLLLMGAGLGLLLAFIIDRAILPHDNNEAAFATSINFGRHHSGTPKNVVVYTDTVHKAGDSATVAAAVPKETVTAVDEDDDDDINDRDMMRMMERRNRNHAIYFALIAIGGGLGLFSSYRIEKREWLDKIKES